LGNAQVKKGDRLMIVWASANRDEQQFESADTFMVDRFPNRHVAFGIGPHRCIGSNMARILFEVMIRKVLERLPDYQIDRERAQHYPTMSAINNWIGLPCTFTPGVSGNRPVNF
jgi:cytochrome P450